MRAKEKERKGRRRPKISLRLGLMMTTNQLSTSTTSYYSLFFFLVPQPLLFLLLPFEKKGFFSW
jgi:hypothetical protein